MVVDLYVAVFSVLLSVSFCFFFLICIATPVLYTLSLHDALPISVQGIASFSTSGLPSLSLGIATEKARIFSGVSAGESGRSEEHTSELQSLTNLVCRLLLEKKKKKRQQRQYTNKEPLTTHNKPHR